jgi:hypothetical protein
LGSGAQPTNDREWVDSGRTLWPDEDGSFPVSIACKLPVRDRPNSSRGVSDPWTSYFSGNGCGALNIATCTNGRFPDLNTPGVKP